MKIGIICFPSFGGSGALATELGKNLAQRGHKIHFITSDIPFRLIGPWQKNIYFHRVEEVEYPLFKSSLYDLNLASKIAEIAQQHKLDILHIHYSYPHALSAYLAKEIIKPQRIRTIVTLHGTDITLFGVNPITSQINKLGLKNADCITAVCKNLADQTQDMYKFKKIEVIYNFVTIKKEHSEKSKELREIFATEKEKIIIHISNFREVKRVQDIIEVFKGINKKISCKLMLIGDGPELRLAQRLTNKYNLNEKVHFMGVQNNVSKLLSISDLMVLPSEKEAFNLSALESLACGVPIVTTNVGGMPEMIKNGETGFLSDVADINTMISNSLKILTNKNLSQKISINCRKVLKEKYSPEIIVPKYEKLYRQLIGSEKAKHQPK